MKRSAASPRCNNTSSTSNGSNSGMGTLQRVASTATRLASQRAFLWRRARRRISAQLKRSGMVTPFQPAPQQRGQFVERLVAVGQQRQLAISLGQQGGEAGDAEVLHPGEVGEGRLMVGGRVEGVG